jgi:HK97 family phage major capsid protein
MSEQLKALEEQLQQAVADMRSFNEKLEAARAAGGDNPIKAEQLDKAMKAAEDATAQVEALEARLKTLEDQPAGRRTKAAFAGDEVNPDRVAADHWIRGQATADDREYLVRGMGGSGEIIKQMVDAGGSPMYAALATDNTTGHYIIMPPAQAAELMELLRTESAMEDLASVEVIEGDSWEQVKVTAGVTSGWTHERATRTATTDPTFGKDKIDLHSLYAYPTLTQKQVYMSNFDVVGFINNEIAESMSGIKETAYIAGTGIGQPYGLTTNATLQAAAEVSGHASTINSADPFIKITYGIHEKFLANARWQMRRATALALALLKNGSGEYIWRQTLMAGQPDLLCGYPIRYNGYMPAVGAGTFPASFGDHKQGYKIIKNRFVLSLRDEITAPGFVKFYVEMQVGGDVRRTEAVKLLKIAAS